MAWVHSLSPFAVRFGEDFGIRWYGLSYGLGFLAGWMILRALARRGKIMIPPARVGDAIITVALGVIIGGRLGYAFFYRPSLFWTFTGDPPWWELLAVHNGGMASHGGMIGVIVAAWMVSRGWKKQGTGEREGRTTMPHIADVLALVAPVGLLLGRLANFVNAELLGRIVAKPGEPSPWWAVQFPQERLEGDAPALSMEQYVGLGELIDRVRLPSEGDEAGYARVIEQIQGGDRALAQDLAPFLAARYPSQLMQAAAEGLVLGAVLWLIWRKPRRPGVVGAWFLIVYGLLRVLTEVWRLPDAHLEVGRPLGLSRGQWLSVGMVVVGFGVLAWVGRARRPKMGGWGADTGAGAPEAAR